MAEAAVITSVASSVISSTINSLSTLAWDEIKFLKDVPAKVQSIQAKLRLIQSYLKDAENKPQNNHLTRTWLHEMRRLAYQAQDVIEKMQWLQWRRNRRRGCTGAFSRYSNILGYLESLNNIGVEIDRINNFIPGISDMVNNLNVVNVGESSSTADQFENQQLEDPRRAIRFNEEDEVIGFESEITEITKELLNQEYKPLSVVSLVGMGGIGKTTLAKKVLGHSDVKKCFDLIAMITVSREYNVSNLQKEILKVTNKFTNEEVEKMNEGGVRDKLCVALEEKIYLIVIDDIWETRSWDEINSGNKIFPNMYNGSRILLTTRNLDVAKYPNFRILVHEVKLLDDDKCLELLKKKAFPPYVMLTDLIRNELESLFSQLIRKCRGLPLALNVLGGYLSKHLDYQTWSRMGEVVDWNEVGDQIDISKILALSYHDLPTFLKPAFLYITAFPEDHIIECSDIIKLWIAEGLVPHGQKYKSETIAHIYIDQLNERGLVQIVERSRVHRKISRIRIHDVLRDWGIERAKEEGFFHVIEGSNHANPCDAQISYRVALHGYHDKDTTTLMPNVRTMLAFELSEISVLLRGLQSLRVVSLTGNKKNMVPLKCIKHMIFLRYICIRNCSQVYFPSSIGELGNLQTLDCLETKIMCLPSSLWEISTLRHVHLQWIYCKWSGPKKGSGKNLRTLILIETGGSLIATNWMYTGMNGVGMAIEEMEQIVKLDLRSVYYLHKDMFSNISGFRYIEELTLMEPKGMIRLPTASVFPQSIVKLQLSCEELVEDPMPVLQGLPKLVDLNLHWSDKLKSMHCSTGGFPRLKYLDLWSFNALEQWTVDVGAMPYLCELMLVCSRSLKEFPEGLMEHGQLQLVDLKFVPHLSKVDYTKLQEKGCTVKIRG